MKNQMLILSQRRASLVRQKEEYHREYLRRAEELDAQIKEIDSAISTINIIIEPYLCKRCNGEGCVHITDAAGSREEITCPSCSGTGIDKSTTIQAEVNF